MRRYETVDETRPVKKLADVICDNCGAFEPRWRPFIQVHITVNEGEEYGSDDWFDYCEECITGEPGRKLRAAGATSALVAESPER